MITLFLAGDVMPGRGIDQVLAHPSDPRLHEPYVRDARTYVRLAERVSGPIPSPVDDAYIWGDALGVLADAAPDARIVNLETAVTQSGEHWPGKGINYRLHPGNVGCLTAAALDCCVLANNHVLDWGYAGFEETLATLHAAGLATAGAGLDAAEAAAPAVIGLGGERRVLVFAFGSETSGIPHAWAAHADRPGVDLLPDLSTQTAEAAARAIGTHRQAGDLVVVSIHWGGNWGYRIPQAQQDFAHALLDRGAADLIHGHSSHHPRGVEIYRDRPILYGCGDFLNDYEGISGHEEFRGDLSLAYLVQLGTADGVSSLEMVPFQMRGFRLRRAPDADTEWLRVTLDRECVPLGARVERTARGTLTVHASKR